MPTPSAWDMMQGFVGSAAKAHRDRNYVLALDECRQGMIWLTALVKESEGEAWYKDPLRYPILEHFLRLAPVALDEKSLQYVLEIVNQSPGLSLYRADAEAALAHAARAAALYSLIASNPGIIQSKIARDWPPTSDVLYAAEAMGLVRRTKVGASYALEMLVDHSKRPLR